MKCLCWSLGHAEQLLFSCLWWKVSICNYVSCVISHFTCHMSYVKCLCWFLGHTEQLLFSCLCSKVSICNYVTCRMSHVTWHMSYVKCLYWSLGHAEQLLFSCLMSHDTCHILPFTCHMLYVKCLLWKVSICNYVTCQMLMLILGTCWTTFVFMSMHKSEYLQGLSLDFHFSILGYEKKISNQFPKNHKNGHRNLNQFPLWK